MKLTLPKSMPGSKPGGRPPVAVELSPEGALAAALPSPGAAPVYAFSPLPSGAIAPGIGQPNILASNAVSDALRSALDQVSPRTRSVTLVVPDNSVRIFILDFDSLPTRSAEALPVLRFRLRKMVPFDVEHAGISYQVLSQKTNEWKVLTAILPGPILAEYEEAVRSAGYEPGAILPSSLASLEAIDSMEAVLAANLSSVALTTSITNGNDLLLHRTLDLPENPELRLAEIQRGIAVAAAYFEDKLQAPAQTLHYAGAYRTADFAAWLNYPDLNIIDLVPRPQAGLATSLGNASIAAATGALVGAS